MASRMKEDERNERTIRNLLKLPENRRCINCNSLGPQYVCTNFWTFVCTTCSGIHREFTHRVKSVSMAKFTSQEVSALQGGGNASAKEIYFKEWDHERQSFPDSSSDSSYRNTVRLRDFIKHVYVDRKYTGEKSFDKPPSVKRGEAEDSYPGGSRSPNSERFSPGGRSDDRNSKNSPDGGSKNEGKSPDRKRDSDMSSPPIMRPVREILGERASPLPVIEPPKENGLRPSDGSLHMQRSISSSSLAPTNANPAETRTESSLIDFDDVPEPPTAQVVSQPTPSKDNWANFDSVQEVKASHAPSNTNLLDVLSELSVPSSSSFPSNATPLTAPVGTTWSPFGTTATVGAPTNHSTVAHDGGQWQSVHPQQNLLPVTGYQAPARSFNQAVGGSQNNQPWNPSFGGNTQVLSRSHDAQSQVTHGVDVKQNTKKELPADLFSSNYSSFATPNPGWFPSPQYGIGYNMQYNVPVPMPPAYMQPSRASNPFDVNESSPLQPTTHLSMAPLQGALPNIHRSSSVDTLSPAWMPTTQSSSIQRTSSFGTLSPPSYGPPMPSGPFMGQAAPIIPKPQAAAGFFGWVNPSQQQSGNPFG